MAKLTALAGDAYLRQARYREIVSELDVNQVTTLRGSDGPQQAVEKGAMLPFMDPALVIRIDGAMKSPEQSGKRSAAAKTPWTDAVAEMAAMPDTTHYIWLDDSVPKSNATRKQIEKHGVVETLDAPKGAALTKWIAQEIRRRGGSANQAACSMLAERTKADLWRAAQECEKVALYCNNRTATADDVDLLVETNPEDTIFAALDHLFSGRPQRSAQIAESLLDQGQSPFYVLTMLQREGRLMLTTYAMQQEGATPADILDALGTKSEFVLRKSRQRATQLGKNGIQAWHDILINADAAIKTGALDDDQALYWALGSLGDLTGP